MFRTPSRFPHGNRVLCGIVSLACAASLTTAESGWADDWPFFRGPNFNGVSSESGWTADWSVTGPEVAWRADVGIGASSVVVVGDRVITMGSREPWRIDWRTNYDCNASTPTVVGDKLFISTGYGGRRARGALFHLDEGEPRQIWLNQDLETRTNSAVVYEGHVYCVSERSGGQLMCFDLRDGAIIWAEPSFAPYGTLMIAGGGLVVLDEQGDFVIAEATPSGYHELARAKVHSGRCWVMPVLANGRIYAKTNKGELACLDVRTSR